MGRADGVQSVMRRMRGELGGLGRVRGQFASVVGRVRNFQSENRRITSQAA